MRLSCFQQETLSCISHRIPPLEIVSCRKSVLSSTEPRTTSSERFLKMTLRVSSSLGAAGMRQWESAHPFQRQHRPALRSQSRLKGSFTSHMMSFCSILRQYTTMLLSGSAQKSFYRIDSTLDLSCTIDQMVSKDIDSRFAHLGAVSVFAWGRHWLRRSRW